MATANVRRVSMRASSEAVPSTLEIELRADFKEASVQDSCGHLPGGVAVVQRQHDAGIEKIVEIKVDRGPRAPELEQLAQSHIDLICALAVQRAGRHEIHCRIRATR